MAFTHVKVGFTFTSAAGDTWSESFYRTANTLGTYFPLLTGAADKAIDWSDKRKACLSSAFRIATCSIRAAPLPGAGESSTRKGLNFKIPNGQGSRDARRDVGATTANVTISTATDHSRVYQMHGVPDVDISYAADGSANSGLPAGVLEFMDYLIANDWQLRTTLIAANDPNILTVNAITVALGAVTMTVPGLVIPAGTKRITVSGAKGWKAGQFNGVWVIGSYNVGTGALILTSKRLIDPEIYYVSNSATVRLVNQTLVSFENVSKFSGSIAPRTRKVGNPFEKQAGRRSVKR